MDRGAVRARSAAVFGNRHRAELLAALAAAGERGVCLGELADSLGMPASVYHAQMRALLGQGLVEKLPIVVGDRRRHYRRCGDTALWGALAAAAAALGAGGPGAGAAAGPCSRGRVPREQASRAR
jgi:DNA-binding transcriptional ArsR family regulator